MSIPTDSLFLLAGYDMVYMRTIAEPQERIHGSLAVMLAENCGLIVAVPPSFLVDEEWDEERIRER